MHRFTFLTLLLLAACGTDSGDTETSAGTTSSDPDTTATEATGASTGPAGDTTSGVSDGDDTTGETTATPTTDISTTSSTSTTGPDDTTDATTTADTTTGVALNFNRFLTNRSAGPCPPDADCDGFIELVAPGTLRVEKFGDVADNVTEVQISADDFDAAAAVFADPELFALLSQDDIICNPPTDVFEDMLVDLDGNIADNSTTGCDNPPVAAARVKANELADKYVP